MREPDELGIFVQRFEALGIPYMVTGATAAILYGQPRVTNDLDVVVTLTDAMRANFLTAFPEADFFVPPEGTVRTEQARAQRGHFNLIHHKTGYKADVYLTGSDPLHAWALGLRRRLPWNEKLHVVLAPPEYVILRKLEFFREGGSSKHLDDIGMIRKITGVDETLMRPWLERMGLGPLWNEVSSRQ